MSDSVSKLLIEKYGVMVFLVVILVDFQSQPNTLSKWAIPAVS